MIHIVPVEFKSRYYQAYWSNENEFLGYIRPEELSSVSLIGDSKVWFDMDTESFYFKSESYDLFSDAVVGLKTYFI